MISIPKIIEIIEQEKDKYRFMKMYHSDGDKKRCAIGLLLSHYGWDGKKKGERWNEGKGYMLRGGDVWKRMKDDLDMKDDEGFDTIELDRINDESESYDQVIEKLKEKVDA